MAQINQNRYETLAARVLGVKGAGIFGHAEDAVFAGLALDTNAPLELWYPQRIYRYGIGGLIVLHATQNGGFELRNSTTDMLWIIDHVVLSSSGNTEFTLWMGEDTTSSFYVNPLLCSNLDTRISGAAARDWGSFGTGLNTIPGFAQIQTVACLGKRPQYFNPGVVLGPGGSFIANNGTVGIETRFGMSFHTRQAMPSELT